MSRHLRQRDDGYRRRLREMTHFFDEGPQQQAVRNCRISVVLQQPSQDEVAFQLRRLFEQQHQPCRVHAWQYACSSPEPLPQQQHDHFHGIELIPVMNPGRGDLVSCESIVYITRPDLLSMKRLHHSLRTHRDILRRRSLSLIMAEACDQKRARLYLDFLNDSICDNLQLQPCWVGTLCDLEFHSLDRQLYRQEDFPRQILAV